MSDDDTKQCPFCAETIKAAAIVCRFCNREVEDLTEPDTPEGESLDAQEESESDASDLIKKVTRYAILAAYTAVALFLMSRESETVKLIGMGLFIFLPFGVVVWAIWLAALRLTEGARMRLAVIAVLALGLFTLPLPGSEDGVVRVIGGMGLFLAAAVAWDIGMKPIRDAEVLGAQRVCLTCGTVSVPQRALKGSAWITTLLLLFLFVLPGLIYMAYRRSGRKRGELRVCPECQSRDLVPLDSPAAQRIQGGESE